MELEEQRPLCECHSKPMRRKGKTANGETRWTCAVKAKRSNRRYYQTHRDEVLEKQRDYDDQNRDVIKERKSEYREQHRGEIRKAERKNYRKRLARAVEADREKESAGAALFDEFGGLVTNQIRMYHAKRLLNTQQSAHLDWDDLRQTAYTALWERRDEFDGVTDRMERGRIAMRIINSGLGKMLTANAFFRGDIRNVPELVPIVSSVELGLEEGDTTTFDLALDVDEDFAAIAEWNAAFAALKPRTQQALLMRRLDLTWAEIAQQLPNEFTGEIGVNPMTLAQDIRRDLARHGLDDELPPWPTHRRYTPDEIPKTKPCAHCGEEFSKRPTQSTTAWIEEARFCSAECRTRAIEQQAIATRKNYIPLDDRPRCSTEGCENAVALKSVASNYTGELHDMCHQCREAERTSKKFLATA